MSTRKTAAVYGLVALYLGVERSLRQGEAEMSLDAEAVDQGSMRAIGTALGISGLCLAAAPLLNRYRIAVLPGRRLLFWVGVSSMVSGLIVRSWTIRTLGSAYTRTLQVAAHQRIVQDGPYRVVRHPGYLGTLLVWLGAAVALGNAVTLAVASATLLPVYRKRMDAEEALLLDVFGEEYHRYTSRTKRLVPRIY